jgi:ParB-like nuclease domain
MRALASWPADKVERRPLTSLVPYARNARTHTPAQVAQIAASMKEWGWTNPVLVDENAQILAGHGRILAADVLGFRDVPVMIAEGWSEAQKRAYLIADTDHRPPRRGRAAVQARRRDPREEPAIGPSEPSKSLRELRRSPRPARPRPGGRRAPGPGHSDPAAAQARPPASSVTAVPLILIRRDRLSVFWPKTGKS